MYWIVYVPIAPVFTTQLLYEAMNPVCVVGESVQVAPLSTKLFPYSTYMVHDQFIVTIGAVVSLTVTVLVAVVE